MSTVNNPFSLLPVHNRQQKTKGHKSDNISEHIDKKVGKAYGIPISKISSYFRKQMQIYAVTCITGCAAILMNFFNSFTPTVSVILLMIPVFSKSYP